MAPEPALPIVLVDLDGPLADFDRYFFARCAEHGWELDVSLSDQTQRFATAHMPDVGHRKLAREMINTAGWFAELPVTPGAVDGLHRLSLVADVWLCSKPLEANPTCRDDKAAWIRRNFGEEWEYRLILTSDKSMVRGTYLLDDAPHPEWFPLASWLPVIFPTSWNGRGSKWFGIPRWGWDNPTPLLNMDWHLEASLLRGERAP